MEAAHTTSSSAQLNELMDETKRRRIYILTLFLTRVAKVRVSSFEPENSSFESESSSFESENSSFESEKSSFEPESSSFESESSSFESEKSSFESENSPGYQLRNRLTPELSFRPFSIQPSHSCTLTDRCLYRYYDQNGRPNVSKTAQILNLLTLLIVNNKF